MSSHYGRTCHMDFRATQQAARPEGSGERVITDFISCAPGETPTRRTHQDGTEAFWGCPSTWMSAEDHSNRVGEVAGQVAFEADKRNCYFAFSRLERFDGSFWRAMYVSDSITQTICLTVNGNGQVTAW